MGAKTKIEWTEATWNPVRGCSIVSEGCRNCYAMRMAHRSNRPGGAYESLTRVSPHGPTWTGEVRFVPEMLEYPLQLKEPHRIFVNSMSDLFHEGVTDQQITDIFGIMALAHWHTFQILTKRPERMRSYLAKGDHGIIEQFEAIQRGGGIGPRRMFRALDIKRRDGVGWEWPLPNVWLGVSCEDQNTANGRIPLLLETPASVRWISAEPLLGPIDLTQLTLGYFKNERHGSDFVSAKRLHDAAATPSAVINALTGAALGRVEFDEKLCLTGDGVPPLKWVVVGGESGPGARPMHPAWVRSLRDQCATADVPFFFKQWGKFTVRAGCDDPCGRCIMALPDGSLTGTGWAAGADMRGAIQMHPLPKLYAGNILDGRWHKGYPAQ